ncbi:MAG: hypothetical protein AAGG55_02830 [Pseudomonadota bacterium]
MRSQYQFLDVTTSVEEARLIVGMSLPDVLELCDITTSTWYRWRRNESPRWAVRLIMSQQGRLDRFGWDHWEIRNGVLYCNELHYRYSWEPINLLAPFWGIDPAAVAAAQGTANVASIDAARKDRESLKTLDRLPQLPKPTIKDFA